MGSSRVDKTMGGHKSPPRHRKRSTRVLARDVDKYTKAGTASINDDKLQAALESFELAYIRAGELGEGFTERACAFNLGAVYIAVGQPVKGIKVLQCALPPLDQHDDKSNGDLFYNFALGYGALDKPGEAVRYLEIALEEYQLEKNNYKMEAEITSRMVEIYTNQHDWLQAARANGLASRAYAMLADYEHQAVATSHEAACLYKSKRPDSALQIADECMVLCQKVGQTETLSRLYNELGLTYAQCRDFGKAATCFELALPLSRAPKGDQKQTAVTLQNLGAVYNSLGDFQRAIPLHEEAARQHAEQKNRNAQGQCFTNLAFAYSQVGDTERAGEFYLHTLQASRDTGDMQAQWQAMEGLGAVAFNEGQFERAVRHFRLALTVLGSAERNIPAQERIVAKLTDAIQAMVAIATPKKHKVPGGMVDILINSEPRPSTRKEQRQMTELAELRKEKRKLGKRNNQFATVALGITDYETDSDISLQREKRKSRSRSKRNSKILERSSSLSSPRLESNEDYKDKLKQYPRKLTRRVNSVPPVDMTDGQASAGRAASNFQRPLLRTQSFDSDDERTSIINQPRRGKAGKHAVDEDSRKAIYAGSSRQHIGHHKLLESVTRMSARDTPRSAENALDTPRSPSMTASYQARLAAELDLKQEFGTRLVTPSVIQTTAEMAPDESFTATDTEVEENSEEHSDNEDSDRENDQATQDGGQTLLPPAPPVPISSPNATYLQPSPGPSHQGAGREWEWEAPPHQAAGVVNADIDGDPIYQTINSVKTTLGLPKDARPEPVNNWDEITPAPALPPRPSLKNGVEREAFVDNYDQGYNEKMMTRQDLLAVSEDNDSNPPGKKGKNTSRTCIVM